MDYKGFLFWIAGFFIVTVIYTYNNQAGIALSILSLFILLINRTDLFNV